MVQRVPPEGFAVLANMFVIREVDPNDNENFLMSKSVHSIAREYGWWSEEEGMLDFTKIYSDGEYAHKYYSGRRMWGGFRLAGKDFPAEYSDLQSDPVYPVYTTPVFKLTEQDLFRFHRFTYQGTPYDLGAPGNLAAGPFGSPDRWKAGPAEAQVQGAWERSIGLYRTSDTYVVKSKEGASTGGVLYFGPASALATIFTPFIVGLSEIPASFRSGHQAVFSRHSAFWAACYAHNIANLKWFYAIEDVTARQDELESASIAMVSRMEEHFSIHHDMAAVEEAYLANVDKVVTALWSLSDELMFKYASGFINEQGNMSQMVGYPKWWLEAVGYTEGPPPPPTVPKCCHPPKPANEVTHNQATSSHHVETSQSVTGKAAMRHHLRASDHVQSSGSDVLLD